jgi:hypothetical protein
MSPFTKGGKEEDFVSSEMKDPKGSGAIYRTKLKCNLFSPYVPLYERGK